jgi:hypothetical protein
MAPAGGPAIYIITGYAGVGIRIPFQPHVCVRGLQTKAGEECDTKESDPWMLLN